MAVTKEAYGDMSYSPPNRDIDPKEKKTLGYCVANAKYQYGIFLKDKGGVPSSRYSLYDELRLYLHGRQSEHKYKNFLSYKNQDSTHEDIDVNGVDVRGESSKVEQREGFTNINWDIFSVMPKILNKVHGVLDDIDFSVTAEAIDEKSGAEKESIRYKALVEVLYRDKIEEIMAIRGLQPDEAEQAELPESYEEFKMFEASDGFKPNYCKETEKALEYSFDSSRWGEIKEKLIRDAVSLGIIATRDYYDEGTGSVRIRYSDPKMISTQYSDYDDFRDSEHVMELKYWTISRLKEELPEVE